MDSRTFWTVRIAYTKAESGGTRHVDGTDGKAI